MFEYLLLRDSIKSGPFSIEELKNTILRSTDLIWVQGKSTAWRYTNEIEELQAFVHPSKMNSAYLANAANQIYNKENSENKMMPVGAELKKELIEEREKPAEEKTDVEKNQESFIKRGLAIRKSYINKSDLSDHIPAQSFESGKSEKKADIYPETKIIKVIIADDHTLFREGVKMALTQKKDIQIAGEAENGMQLLHLLKHNMPDVILLDIQMPVMDGITALASIRKRYPDIKVIMLTMHNERSMVSTLMETGANGYLTKTADSEIIYEAIRTCYSKGYYFNELTNMAMLEGLHSKNKMLEKFTASNFESSSQPVNEADVEEMTVAKSSNKIKVRLLIAACSILLITSGVMAALWIFGYSVPGKIILSKNPKKTESTSQQINLPQAASQQSLIADSTKKITDTDSSLQSKANVVSNNNNDSSLQKKENLLLNDKEKTTLSKIGHALNDSDSSLQKKEMLLSDNKEKLLQAKTNHDLNDKKDFASKHKQVKKTGSHQPSSLSAIFNTDSNSSSNNAAREKQSSSSISELKALERNNIRSLVTASLNNFPSGTNGLSNVELTVNNRTIYTLDKVVVEVKYMLDDSTLYKTETLNFEDISPRSSHVLLAPKSAKGMRIEYRILSIASKDLEL